MYTKIIVVGLAGKSHFISPLSTNYSSTSAALSILAILSILKIDLQRKILNDDTYMT